MNGDLGRGSARSYGGSDMGARLPPAGTCSRPMAAIARPRGSPCGANLLSLRRRLEELAGVAEPTTLPTPLALDGELDLADVEAP